MRGRERRTGHGTRIVRLQLILRSKISFLGPDPSVAVGMLRAGSGSGRQQESLHLQCPCPIRGQQAVLCRIDSLKASMYCLGWRMPMRKRSRYH